MEEELKNLQTAVEEKLKKAATKEDIEKVKSEISEQINGIAVGASKEELETIKSEFDAKLKAQWAETEAKLAEGVKSEKPLTFGEQLKSEFEKAGFIENEGVKFDINDTASKIRVKAAFDMNTAGTTASVATGYQTNYGMMVQKLQSSSEVNILDVLPSMPLAPIERYMAKVVEYDETDGSAQKAETTAAGDSSFKLKTEDFKIFQFGVKFRVHRNMLRQWSGLQQRIQSIGMERLKNKIALFLLDKAAAGDGSTIPFGILSTGKYTAYDTALRAQEVKGATIVDVVKNAVLQSQLLGTENEMGNKTIDTVLLNPVDIANIESLKDQNDNSIRLAGLVVDASGKLSYIYGLRVIAKKYVTANTAVFMNTTTSPAVEIGTKQNMELIIGYDKSEDLSKGIVTIQLESEYAFGLGDPESTIYCSSISDAATALTSLITQ
jgi:hypothetical protein